MPKHPTASTAIPTKTAGEERAAAIAPQQRLAVRPKEAGAMLGIGQTSLYAAMKSGSLPCRRLGGATVILVSDLQKYAESLPSGR